MEKIWLKSYHNAVPAEISFEKITLSEALTGTAERFPNNPALLFQGATISFKNWTIWFPGLRPRLALW